MKDRKKKDRKMKDRKMKDRKMKDRKMKDSRTRGVTLTERQMPCAAWLFAAVANCRLRSRERVDNQQTGVAFTGPQIRNQNSKTLAHGAEVYSASESAATDGTSIIHQPPKEKASQANMNYPPRCRYG
jgi:hypothetical protein